MPGSARNRRTNAMVMQGVTGLYWSISLSSITLSQPGAGMLPLQGALQRTRSKRCVKARLRLLSSRSCFKSGDGDSYAFDLQGVISIYVHV